LRERESDNDALAVLSGRLVPVAGAEPKKAAVIESPLARFSKIGHSRTLVLEHVEFTFNASVRVASVFCRRSSGL